jgi:pyridoxal phosphate enzyme (YggS family)
MARDEQIAEGLRATQQRIANACAAAGRSASEVTLVVVTKTFPASDVRILADLGVRDVAENRAQELRTKSEEVQDRDVIWHFIGRMQRNKAALIMRHATVVESVDRIALVEPMARAGSADVLVQVSLDDPPDRGGVAPDALLELAQRVDDEPTLRLRGLMAIAPHPGDPNRAFAHLADIRQGFLAHYPHATALSAGMSGDLEAAIAWGATQVRVGGAILGNRPPVQ